MTLSKEIEAKILRYHYVEKWRIGTIARELSVHHSVVSRVLARECNSIVTLSNNTATCTVYIKANRSALDRKPAVKPGR